MSPDPNAEAEAASVVKKLQTGEYVFLDEQARRVTDSEGSTLADRFHSSKQMYLTFPSLVKSELVVSLFLASVTEARIHGALIDTKSRSYLRIVDDETE
jgi:hypothetical protein